MNPIESRTKLAAVMSGAKAKLKLQSDPAAAEKLIHAALGQATQTSFELGMLTAMLAASLNNKPDSLLANQDTSDRGYLASLETEDPKLLRARGIEPSRLSIMRRAGRPFHDRIATRIILHDA